MAVQVGCVSLQNTQPEMTTMANSSSFQLDEPVGH